MAEISRIEWTDATWNGWIGCTKISPACDHCYASVSTPSRRLGVEWGAGKARRRTSPDNWKLPRRWNAHAFAQCTVCGYRGVAAGDASCAECHAPTTATRMRVFCSSLADVFDNEVDPSWREDLFELIRETPNLDWLLLTKRVGNVLRMVEAATGQRDLPSNVWIGATIANQEEADRDIPKLLSIPATVRFLSMEPLLGAVDFRWRPYAHQAIGQSYREYLEAGGSVHEYEALRKIDWVIVGGESGEHARPMHPEWARSLRDQCAAAGVPFLFKQWGEWRAVSQGGADWFDSLYKSRRMATNGQDQAALDEAYGRVCTVAQLCLRSDGEHVEAAAPNAFAPDTGAVLAFRTGKKAAGRHLDGMLHDGYPLPRHIP